MVLGLPPFSESEGYDRTSIDLPADQVATLRAVRAVADRVVVVLSNGGVVSVADWQDSADAILEGWLLGQEGGAATVDLLLGDVSPSGRLAETIPLRLQDHPAYLTFPGDGGVSVYGESIHVGYRGFQAAGVPVAYPFGHGLTYTTFEYAGLAVRATGPEGWSVTFTLTNTGTRRAAEVAQLYVGRGPGSAVLRGFAKLELDPGEAREVTLTLRADDLRTWDARIHQWTLAAGEFVVGVGASSADVRLTTTITCAGDRVLVPLSGASTIGEWRSDPAGAQVLGELLARMSSSLSEPVSPDMAGILAGVPLRKLKGFGIGITDEVVAALVARATELQDALVASGDYSRPVPAGIPQP